MKAVKMAIIAEKTLNRGKLNLLEVILILKNKCPPVVSGVFPALGSIPHHGVPLFGRVVLLAGVRADHAGHIGRR